MAAGLEMKPSNHLSALSFVHSPQLEVPACPANMREANDNYLNSDDHPNVTPGQAGSYAMCNHLWLSAV